MQFQERISRELDELRSLDRYRILPDITSRHGKHISVNGQLLLNLSSNDYLGLGDDKEMLAGYVETAQGEQVCHDQLLLPPSDRKSSTV